MLYTPHSHRHFYNDMIRLTFPHQWRRRFRVQCLTQWQHVDLDQLGPGIEPTTLRLVDTASVWATATVAKWTSIPARTFRTISPCWTCLWLFRLCSRPSKWYWLHKTMQVAKERPEKTPGNTSNRKFIKQLLNFFQRPWYDKV